jgi:hypothetical protein
MGLAEATTAGTNGKRLAGDALVCRADHECAMGSLFLEILAFKGRYILVSFSTCFVVTVVLGQAPVILCVVTNSIVLKPSVYMPHAIILFKLSTCDDRE